MKRDAELLRTLVVVCDFLTTFELRWGHPKVLAKPYDLLQLTDTVMGSIPFLEKITLEYRGRVSLKHNISYLDARFSHSFADFSALTFLKLGMILIFDFPPLKSPQDWRPLDVAQLYAHEGVENRFPVILPPQLQTLVVRRHGRERQVPLLLNVENLFKARDQFGELKEVVGENTYDGSGARCCDELKEEWSCEDAVLELQRRGRNIGIEFSSIDNCPK